MDARQIRKELGLTRAQMARACNTHEMTVGKWESKERRPRGQAQRLLELLVDLKNKGLFSWYTEKYMGE